MTLKITVRVSPGEISGRDGWRRRGRLGVCPSDVLNRLLHQLCCLLPVQINRRGFFLLPLPLLFLPPLLLLPFLSPPPPSFSSSRCCFAFPGPVMAPDSYAWNSKRPPLLGHDGKEGGGGGFGSRMSPMKVLPDQPAWLFAWTCV